MGTNAEHTASSTHHAARRNHRHEFPQHLRQDDRRPADLRRRRAPGGRLLLRALVRSVPQLHAEAGDVPRDARGGGRALPVVFGSSDKDEASFQSYFSSMTGDHWHAFPLGDARIEALKKQFGVSGIPWLVILDKEGNLVLNEADETIGKGTVAYQEWLAKASTGANSPMAR